MASPSFGKIHRVHHINGATFRPAPFVRLPTHVVVLECEAGVVLVDVGLGSEDIRRPLAQLGPFVLPLAPVLDETQTVVRQLAHRGIAKEDVTDIVATHLDYDHIGGASDFPAARLHVTDVELIAATERRGLRDRLRYRRQHLVGLRSIQTYRDPTSSVLDLAAHPIDDLEQVFLLPMPGHTGGHAAVAIRDPRRGWLIAAGDAAMHRNAHTPGRRPPLPIRGAERLLAMQPEYLSRNHQILQSLVTHGYRVFCSHDPKQLADLDGETT